MKDSRTVVEAFFDAWGTSADDFRGALRRFLAPHVVWDNVGVVKTEGIDAAIAFFDRFAASAGVATFRAQIVAIAANGPFVLTERLDFAILKDGSVRRGPGLRVMGSFEVRDDRIVAWRDYADLSAVKHPPA